MSDLTPSLWRRAQELFEQALEVPADARPALLERLTAGQPTLRAHVEKLLYAHDRRDSLLDVPADALSDLLPEHVDAPLPDNRRVGPYELVQQIGRGGMGVVYLARRADGAFHQRVAVKLIRRGLDTDDVLRRFKMERQILASLNHPHIARLLDGGVTEAGLPYFVLEYIEGRPITQYCDEHRLSVEERLALFQQVAEAVHYAHQSLVVHRDLKPDNILVTADGIPKLLDFGVARLLHPHAAPFTLPLTRPAQRMLTPEYAAPEQLQGSLITTSADVYSLGVLLYELLTGHLPFAGTPAGIADLERRVREEPPERPSRVVTRPVERTTGAGTTQRIEPAQLCQARNTDPARLRQTLRDDLDALLLTALRKEPQRRYASAEQLADDVHRYLTRQPLTAQPDTVGYRTRMFWKRHRAAVVVATVALLALLGALGTAVWQARLAQAERRVAEQERHVAEASLAFMEQLFASASPLADAPERLDTLRVRAFLDRSVARLDAPATEAPAVRARMRHAMGKVYSELRLHDQALPLLQQTLAAYAGLYPAGHPRHVEVLLDLCQDAYMTGRYEDAEQRCRAALAYAEADPGTLQHARAAFLMGHALIRAKQNEAAVPLLEQARQRFAEADAGGVMAVEAQMALAGALLRWSTPDALGDAARMQQAEQLIRDALDTMRRRFGPDHLQLATIYERLGVTLNHADRHAEALPMHQESLRLQQLHRPPGHPLIATALGHLGRTYRALGRLDEAEPLIRRARQHFLDWYGPQNTTYATSTQTLASILQRQGRLDEAEPLIDEAYRIRRAAHPPLHTTLLRIEDMQAEVWLAQQRHAEKLPVLRARLAARADTSHDVAPVRVATAQHFVGESLLRLNRWPEAEPLLRASFAHHLAHEGPDDGDTRALGRLLHAAYLRHGPPDQAAAFASFAP